MKFFYAAMMLVGVVLILNLAGITTPAGGGFAKALGLVDDDGTNDLDNAENSTLWITLIALFAGLATAGVVIGTLGRTPDIQYLTGAIVSVMVSALLTDLIYIWTLIKSTSEGFILSAMTLVIAACITGLVISAFEFWQNVD